MMMMMTMPPPRDDATHDRPRILHRAMVQNDPVVFGVVVHRDARPIDVARVHLSVGRSASRSVETVEKVTRKCDVVDVCIEIFIVC